MDIGETAAIVSAAASVVGIAIQMWMIASTSSPALVQNHGVSLAPAILLAAVGALAIVASIGASDWRLAVLVASAGAVACSTGLLVWFIGHLIRGVLGRMDRRLPPSDR